MAIVKESEVPGDNMTTDQLVKMVADMLLIVRDAKKQIVNNAKFLKIFLVKSQRAVETIKVIKMAQAKAVEMAQQAVKASEFAVEQVNMRPNVVKGFKRLILGKEVTALEVVTEANKKSIEVLKRIEKQKKESKVAIKKLEKSIEDIKTTIAAVEKTISEEIKKVEAVQECIEKELTILEKKAPHSL